MKKYVFFLPFGTSTWLYICSVDSDVTEIDTPKGANGTFYIVESNMETLCDNNATAHCPALGRLIYSTVARFPYFEESKWIAESYML